MHDVAHLLSRSASRILDRNEESDHYRGQVLSHAFLIVQQRFRLNGVKISKQTGVSYRQAMRWKHGTPAPIRAFENGMLRLEQLDRHLNAQTQKKSAL